MRGEQWLKRLIENAQDMVYRMRLSPARGMEYAAGAVEAITGHSPAEFYADPELVKKSIHPDDARFLIETAGDAATMTGPITLRWLHPDGRVVWAEHLRVPVFDSAHRLVAVEGIARDVTGRVETQQRLHDSEDQLRQLAGRLSAAREEERAALARELHDELGQTLTALKLELGRALSLLTDEPVSREAMDRLQSLVGLADIGLTMVKRISTDLRPAALDHLGLVEAVRWEAVTFRARTGIRCHIRASKDATRLNAEQQTVVFRILQEALTNVVRHAGASAVHVNLSERGGLFELRIRDNGRGISQAQIADRRSIGLLGMRERAAQIAGLLTIAGQRGKGTVISVKVQIGGAARRSAAGMHQSGRAARR